MEDTESTEKCLERMAVSLDSQSWMEGACGTETMESNGIACIEKMC
jgi:hypothetical protein